MPSFSWRSSQPRSTAAAAAAAAAEAVAVADGSAPAPAVPVPSAPPVPSSEEVSLAASNSSKLHSASSSLSGGGGEAVSAAAAAAAAADVAGTSGLSIGGNDRGSPPCPIPSSGATFPVSPVAKANGMGSVERYVRCSGGGDGDAGGRACSFSSRPPATNSHLQERGSGRDGDDVAVLATGGDEAWPTTGGRRRTSNKTISIEEADEAAENNMKGERKSQKEDRRMSPPWDDSTLGLLSLSPDELVERVLKVSEARADVVGVSIKERPMTKPTALILAGLPCGRSDIA